MTVTPQREPVAGILRAMALDADVRGELVRAARGRSPEVAHQLTEAETRRHVAALVAAAGDWFGASDRVDGFDRADEENFAAAALLGADRAGQGVPMTAVLRGVQAALTRAIEITADRCRSAGVPQDALLGAVLRLKEYGDAVERQVIHGYRAAERVGPQATGEIRTRLLRRLLVGGTVPAPEELTRAGIRPDRARHCLVTDARDPARARLLGRRLAALGDVFGLVEGRLVGLSPRPPRSEEIGAAALVVVSPPVALDELRPAYRLCVRALETGGHRRRPGPYELTGFAGEIALADQPLLGAYLSGRLLGALDRSDDFHRQLARTALAFLDHGRRLDRTAASLFTHPNTVRYRLGRLQELTGEPLAESPEAGPPAGLSAGRSGGPPAPLSTLHWWWALTDWLRPDPRREPARDAEDSTREPAPDADRTPDVDRATDADRARPRRHDAGPQPVSLRNRPSCTTDTSNFPSRS
ncbi:PucR family transcriptional regulator [Streptomyces sp. NRRL F-5135]|uniref:PucR family transcriptional regulator n=1 Tax=Streptomyces sp. NRRL F-5135 TaxID=1463858 RepID=UPI0007C481B3|nr:PucR family transcriptional regulator [Streptomyces sp. NRRL F-5135]